MRAFPRAGRIAGTLLIHLLVTSIAASSALGEGPSRRSSWAAVGIGLAPSPYGLDGNGSPLGDLALGKGVREQISIVAAVARFAFFGSTPAQFTSVSIGVRAHLSKAHDAEGGPYLSAAPVVCISLYHDRGVPEARILPGIEVAVGTMIPMSEKLALDWSASHVVTPDAEEFSPDPLTNSTKRNGLDRGAVRIRLVLRR